MPTRNITWAPILWDVPTELRPPLPNETLTKLKQRAHVEGIHTYQSKHSLSLSLALGKNIFFPKEIGKYPRDILLHFAADLSIPNLQFKSNSELRALLLQYQSQTNVKDSKDFIESHWNTITASEERFCSRKMREILQPARFFLTALLTKLSNLYQTWLDTTNVAQRRAIYLEMESTRRAIESHSLLYLDLVRKHCGIACTGKVPSKMRDWEESESQYTHKQVICVKSDVKWKVGQTMGDYEVDKIVRVDDVMWIGLGEGYRYHYGRSNEEEEESNESQKTHDYLGLQFEPFPPFYDPFQGGPMPQSIPEFVRIESKIAHSETIKQSEPIKWSHTAWNYIKRGANWLSKETEGLDELLLSIALSPAMYRTPQRPIDQTSTPEVHVEFTETSPNTAFQEGNPPETPSGPPIHARNPPETASQVGERLTPSGPPVYARNPPETASQVGERLTPSGPPIHARNPMFMPRERVIGPEPGITKPPEASQQSGTWIRGETPFSTSPIILIPNPHSFASVVHPPTPSVYHVPPIARNPPETASQAFSSTPSGPPIDLTQRERVARRLARRVPTKAAFAPRVTSTPAPTSLEKPPRPSWMNPPTMYEMPASKNPPETSPISTIPPTPHASPLPPRANRAKGVNDIPKVKYTSQTARERVSENEPVMSGYPMQRERVRVSENEPVPSGYPSQQERISVPEREILPSGYPAQRERARVSENEPVPNGYPTQRERLRVSENEPILSGYPMQRERIRGFEKEVLPSGYPAQRERVENEPVPSGYSAQREYETAPTPIGAHAVSPSFHERLARSAQREHQLRESTRRAEYEIIHKIESQRFSERQSIEAKRAEMQQMYPALRNAALLRDATASIVTHVVSGAMRLRVFQAESSKDVLEGIQKPVASKIDGEVQGTTLISFPDLPVTDKLLTNIENISPKKVYHLAREWALIWGPHISRQNVAIRNLKGLVNLLVAHADIHHIPMPTLTKTEHEPSIFHGGSLYEANIITGQDAWCTWADDPIVSRTAKSILYQAGVMEAKINNDVRTFTSLQGLYEILPELQGNILPNPHAMDSAIRLLLSALRGRQTLVKTPLSQLENLLPTYQKLWASNLGEKVQGVVVLRPDTLILFRNLEPNFAPMLSIANDNLVGWGKIVSEEDFRTMWTVQHLANGISPEVVHVLAQELRLADWESAVKQWNATHLPPRLAAKRIWAQMEAISAPSIPLVNWDTLIYNTKQVYHGSFETLAYISVESWRTMNLVDNFYSFMGVLRSNRELSEYALHHGYQITSDVLTVAKRVGNAIWDTSCNQLLDIGRLALKHGGPMALSATYGLANIYTSVHLFGENLWPIAEEWLRRIPESLVDTFLVEGNIVSPRAVIRLIPPLTKVGIFVRAVHSAVLNSYFEEIHDWVTQFELPTLPSLSDMDVVLSPVTELAVERWRQFQQATQWSDPDVIQGVTIPAFDPTEVIGQLERLARHHETLLSFPNVSVGTYVQRHSKVLTIQPFRGEGLSEYAQNSLLELYSELPLLPQNRLRSKTMDIFASRPSDLTLADRRVRLHLDARLAQFDITSPFPDALSAMSTWMTEFVANRAVAPSMVKLYSDMGLFMPEPVLNGFIIAGAILDYYQWTYIEPIKTWAWTSLEELKGPLRRVSTNYEFYESGEAIFQPNKHWQARAYEDHTVLTNIGPSDPNLHWLIPHEENAAILSSALANILEVAERNHGLTPAREFTIITQIASAGKYLKVPLKNTMEIISAQMMSTDPREIQRIVESAFHSKSSNLIEYIMSIRVNLAHPSMGLWAALSFPGPSKMVKALARGYEVFPVGKERNGALEYLDEIMQMAHDEVSSITFGGVVTDANYYDWLREKTPAHTMNALSIHTAPNDVIFRTSQSQNRFLLEIENGPILDPVRIIETRAVMNEIREFWKSDHKRMLMAFTLLFGITDDQYPSSENLVNAMSVAKRTVDILVSKPDLETWYPVKHSVHSLLQFLDNSLPQNLPGMNSVEVSNHFANLFLDALHTTGLKIAEFSNRIAFDTDLELMLLALSNEFTMDDQIILAELWKNPILQSREQQQIARQKRRAALAEDLRVYQLERIRSLEQETQVVPITPEFIFDLSQQTVSKTRTSPMYPTNPVMALLTSLTGQDLSRARPGSFPSSDDNVFHAISRDWINPAEAIPFLDNFMYGDRMQAMDIYQRNAPLLAQDTRTQLYLRNLIPVQPVTQPDNMIPSTQRAEAILLSFLEVADKLKDVTTLPL